MLILALIFQPNHYQDISVEIVLDFINKIGKKHSFSPNPYSMLTLSIYLYITVFLDIAISLPIIILLLREISQA